MAIPAKLKQQIETCLGTDISFCQGIYGGNFADAMTLHTVDGNRYFLKYAKALPHDLFLAEAHGLGAIAATNSIRTPGVLNAGADHLLLEWIDVQPARDGFWAVLGRQLATMHNQTSERFGFGRSNYCGATHQPNAWSEDGNRFFAEQRLLYQSKLAFNRGLLSVDDNRRIERLCARLPELVPEQPASLIHGDLWSGNKLCDAAGLPVLIDPACYYGWAEAELAMPRLFGGFDEAFYQAYQEVCPLQPGWEERCEIYNLYHLLNHLNLFGSGYYFPVQSILKHYD
ncbi:MAG: fructosamine kinase family protein [Porticoccaceae bacterium]